MSFFEFITDLHTKKNVLKTINLKHFNIVKVTDFANNSALTILQVVQKKISRVVIDCRVNKCTGKLCTSFMVYQTSDEFQRLRLKYGTIFAPESFG